MYKVTREGKKANTEACSFTSSGQRQTLGVLVRLRAFSSATLTMVLRNSLRLNDAPTKVLKMNFSLKCFLETGPWSRSRV